MLPGKLGCQIGVLAAEILQFELPTIQLLFQLPEPFHIGRVFVVLGLALLRILWKLMSKGRPSPVPMPALQRMAAAAGHGLLYLLILAQPISGWMMSSAANYPVSFFGLFQFPAIVGPNPGAHETYEEVHASRKAGVPAGRFGQAEEFGAAAAFMCSAHAGFITGQNLLLDGGIFPGAL